MLGGVVPAIIVDNVYERPDEIREMALQLTYTRPPYPYPGKLAIPPPNPSLTNLIAWALALVTDQFLPRVPSIIYNGQSIAAFRNLHTDFGIVDVHPDDLSQKQRIPHTDPVPVFGLIYLNREDRGGTLFFEQVPGPLHARPAEGYMTSNDSSFRLRARIEAAFNRLAIYPGFVPHSGEISGDWIKSDERFRNPRLTQRLVFFP